ncbi:MAG: hypothetical protein KY439_10285 [Actinobacteria bacterium]|nr:hypothetical protein [Actinomycetota bacterium]
MTRRERPPAVTRHCNSTLWLPLATVAFFGWFFVTEDVPAAKPERLDAAEEVAVDGLVVATKPGGAVEFRYLHPATDQTVTTEVYVWDRDLVPERGGRVRLLARRDDPLAAVAEGDVMPLHTNLVVYGAWLVGALLPPLMRRFAIRRTERLVAAPVPSFSMVAAVAPRPGRRFRCDLHLYPLDATEGAPPLCSVPILVTGQARLGTQVFPVEVKGSPRPLGSVVARRGELLLWPAGRAGRRAEHPRPGGPPRPVQQLPAASATGGHAGPPGLVTIGREAALLVAALVLLAFVVAVTAATAAEERQAFSGAAVVLGEVVDHEGTDDVVVLRYGREGESRTTRAPADFASDYRKGIRYPARLHPTDPARARLVAEPYDPVEPVVWGALPAMILGVVLWSRWRNWRRNCRVAREGPWWQAWARAGEADEEIVLTDDQGSVVSGAIARNPGPWLDRPAPVVVAGSAEPGTPIAVWLVDGASLAIVHPATNGAGPTGRWSWWREGRRHHDR